MYNGSTFSVSWEGRELNMIYDILSFPFYSELPAYSTKTVTWGMDLCCFVAHLTKSFLEQMVSLVRIFWLALDLALAGPSLPSTATGYFYVN